VILAVLASAHPCTLSLHDALPIWDRSFRSAVSAMFLGEIAVYAVGLPWLRAATHVSMAQTLEWGLYPFVIGDTVKLLIAAGLLRSEEHTSELQSRVELVCRLLLEK